MYINDVKPRIEEIEWRGLEKTISNLEARDKSKQEKAENEIINPNHKQHKKKIDNYEKEDIQTGHEPENKDKLNVPTRY